MLAGKSLLISSKSVSSLLISFPHAHSNLKDTQQAPVKNSDSSILQMGLKKTDEEENKIKHLGVGRLYKESMMK